MASPVPTRSGGRPLRLLALDGGGVRGLVTLLMLRRLMYLMNNTSPPKPCDVFDVIAGTSTGGLIAIMLGRLEMDVETAIKVYLDLSKTIFVPRKRAGFPGRMVVNLMGGATFDYRVLEDAIKSVVRQALGGQHLDGRLEEAPLLQEDPKCKIFVCASMLNAATQRLRNYRSVKEEHIECTIWQAARATSAAPTFFDAIKFPNGSTFRDGALRDNNPIFELINEVAREFPDRGIGTVLSLGTGVSGTISLGNSRLISLAQACSRIATDTEANARRFTETHCRPGGRFRNNYFRFNVAQGLQDVGLEEWERVDEMQASTQTYLQQEDEMLLSCVRSLQRVVEDDHSISNEQSDPRSGAGPSSELASPRSTTTLGVSHPWSLKRKKDTAPEGAKETWRKLTNSLDSADIEDRYNSIQSAHSDTCKWLLTNQKYQSWLDDTLLPQHHGFLWLKGNPGAGKSTMMKFAVSEASRMREEDIHIHFFFNARGSSLEKSTEGMYRSLLFRFFQRLPTAEEVFASFDVLELPKAPNYSWTLQQLQEVLRRSIEGLGDNRLWIYVDALDEGNEDEIRRMISFFELLGKEVVEKNIKMRVFFASRYYPNIRVTKKVELKLEEEPEHVFDIESYIESQLITGDDTKSSKVLRIREEISRRASGVFIWVVIVIQILNKAYDHGQIHELEEKLNNIPQELGLLFKETLTRDNDNMEATRLCIQWVLFAKRSLTRKELYFAIYSGTHPNRVGKLSDEITTKDIDAFILSSSKGLVQPTGRYVQFIHETVRDFFLKENGMQYIQEMSAQPPLGSGHDSLKQCCINCILSSDTHVLPGSFPEIGLEDIKALPFFAYAHSRVFYHANVAEANGASQASFLQKFDFRTWIRLAEAVSRLWSYECAMNPKLPSYEYESYDYYSPDSTLLYILAEQNLKWLIETMLRMYPQIDIDGERLASPIGIAMSRNRYEAVEAFLTLSDAENLAGDHDPTAFAQPLDENEIFDLILTYHYWHRKSEISDSSVLQFFLQWGYESHALTLLRSGRIKLRSNTNSQTPLWIAAQRGYGELVEFLLSQRDVNPDQKDSDGLTPLAVSAREGRLDIAQLLVNSTGVNVNSKCVKGRTPLSYAAERGHQNVVELLLGRNGIDPNESDEALRTPFSYASIKGHEGIIQLLVATPGIDIESQTNGGHTSLSYAAINGHEGVVRQLLATRRFDLNSRDNKHRRTPLSFAFQYQRWGIANLLLAEPSIDVNAPLRKPSGSYSTENEDDRTPLSWAAANGHLEMVNLLLSMDDVEADVKEIKDGRTPLSLAAKKGHDLVVKCLLATHEVDPDSKDTEYGRTPLWWAAEQGHDAVVKLLLAEDDVNVNIQDTQHGQSPLSVAAGNGHEAVVKLLLANPLVNRHLVDGYGNNPQSLAIVKGHHSIVQLLGI